MGWSVAASAAANPARRRASLACSRAHTSKLVSGGARASDLTDDMGGDLSISNNWRDYRGYDNMRRIAEKLITSALRLHAERPTSRPPGRVCRNVKITVQLGGV